MGVGFPTRVYLDARMGRRAALAVVFFSLILLNHTTVDQYSTAALSDLVADRGFRTVEPRLPITVRHRRFRMPVAERLLSPNLKRKAAELISIDSSSSPDAIHRAGLTRLLLGDWNAAIDHLSHSTITGSEIELASAYYMRGLASGSLNDSVRALQLLAGAGRSPMATFNRALVLEAVCDRDAAAAEWREYLSLDSTSEWAVEAREHLELDTRPPAWQVWQTEKPKLIAAATTGDAPSLETLVEAHRYSARKLTELELLPSWAAARLDHDEKASRRNLFAARSIASILKSRTGESLTSDVVDEIERAVATDAAAASRLAEALVAYRRGRTEIDAIDYAHARADLDQASAAVSPGSAAAALFSVPGITARYYLYDYAGANDLIDRTEGRFASRSNRYIALFGHLAWLRGLVMVAGGDSGGALDQYARALSVFERLGELDPQAAQHTNMADSLKLLGETERAAFHRQKALAIAEQLDETRRLHPILSDAAGAALAAGLPAAALSFQNRLVRLSRESGAALRIADSLVVRSTIFTRLGRRADALRDLTEGAGAVQGIADNPTQMRVLADIASAESFAYRGADDQRTVANLTRAIDLFRTLQFHVHIAQLLLERGRARMRLGDAKGAEDDFRAGIADLEQRRRSVQQADLRISYFDRAEILFADLATSLLRRGQFEEAFDLLERARARELLDATTLSPGEPLPARTIQHRLPPDTRLVAFTATSSAVITSVLSRDSFRMFESGFGAAELEQAVRVVTNDFSSKRPPGRDLRRLAELLIGPIELEEGVRVIFVPDPLLYRVPFAALMERGKYLVESHVIQIAPSATLAVRALAPDVREPSHRDESILLVASKEAPVAYPSLAPLDQAIDEALRIAPLYRRHRLLLGSDSDATSMLSIGSDYEVINFAGHAVIDERRPQESSLLVGRNGRIRAADIEQSRLQRTRLVVLGGCSTGVGEAHRSEGVLSLARSFLAAGVPSVVGTIAPVDDHDSSEMLIAFHTAYAKGLDPASALRSAQLRMLRGKDRYLADPSVWGAFQVVSVECVRQTEREEKTSWASR